MMEFFCSGLDQLMLWNEDHNSKSQHRSWTEETSQWMWEHLVPATWEITEKNALDQHRIYLKLHKEMKTNQNNTSWFILNRIATRTRHYICLHVLSKSVKPRHNVSFFHYSNLLQATIYHRISEKKINIENLGFYFEIARINCKFT